MVVDLNEYKYDRQFEIGAIVECIVPDWKGLKGVITDLDKDDMHIQFGLIDFVTCKEDFKNVFKFV
ncbi:transcription elongation factor [Clostridium moniliforme]|uniref:Transcription elongation factor n=1 Tax=Clostridium moniliforme TaxID=39489 RepID=A0ABS4F0J8_9CLOT|nr:hypothetical protein [Clostridium moniliforme]MBP1889779.1 transcription elongation factor [Clostridium moniliforme]